MSHSLAGAPFLPAQAPQGAVIDCSGLLSAEQLGRLNQQAQYASFAPRFVVLPKRFSPRSIPKFTYDISQQWHMPDNGLLMVVDLRGRKMRVMAGSKLQKAGGLTDSKITLLVKNKFLASMRQVKSRAGVPDGLEKAISNMITGVNDTLPASWAKTQIATSEQTQTTQVQQSLTSYPQNIITGNKGTFFVVLLVAVIIALVIYTQVRSWQKKNLG
jgi:uncharacterized membrane protein YgcG